VEVEIGDCKHGVGQGRDDIQNHMLQGNGTGESQGIEEGIKMKWSW
jgi:hypothetical protein